MCSYQLNFSSECNRLASTKTTWFLTFPANTFGVISTAYFIKTVFVCLKNSFTVDLLKPNDLVALVFSGFRKVKFTFPYRTVQPVFSSHFVEIQAGWIKQFINFCSHIPVFSPTVKVFSLTHCAFSRTMRCTY